MSSDASATHSERVVVVAPTPRDEEVTCRLLQSAGIECVGHKRAEDVSDVSSGGIGALLLTDISITDERSADLLRAVEQQPAWSSIPILILCRDGLPSPAVLPLISRFRNVSVLDRPSSMRALVSATRAALLGRRWQYQIRDQMIELESVQAALRLADRRKDEFLATLAHELRNPLAPIRTGVQLLEAIRTDVPQFTRVRSMMERQLSQLVKLIDDLLDVSRIATGKIGLHLEPLDLRAVIRTAIESCEPAIDAAGHTLFLELPGAPIRIRGDHTRLAQAFSNIIHNAVKYTPRGGRVVVTAAVDASQAIVTVKDSGVGIPADMLVQVFDLFAQVNQTLDRAQGGLGIGLSLVKSLVDMHHGSVQATSEGTGLGSVFTVRLPLDKGEA